MPHGLRATVSFGDLARQASPAVATATGSFGALAREKRGARSALSSLQAEPAVASFGDLAREGEEGCGLRPLPSGKERRAERALRQESESREGGGRRALLPRLAPHASQGPERSEEEEGAGAPSLRSPPSSPPLFLFPLFFLGRAIIRKAFLSSRINERYC